VNLLRNDPIALTLTALCPSCSYGLKCRGTLLAVVAPSRLPEDPRMHNRTPAPIVTLISLVLLVVAACSSSSALGDAAARDGAPAGDGAADRLAPPPDAGGAEKGFSIVPCTTDSDCPDEKPSCQGPSYGCVYCDGGPKDVCARRDPTKPYCGPTRACVACASDANCKDASAPICDPSTYTCRACAIDADCVEQTGGSRSFCVPALGGRCTLPAEYIYAQKNDACLDPPVTAPKVGGLPLSPWCKLEEAIAQISGTQRLIIVRGELPDTAANITLMTSDAPVTILSDQHATLSNALDQPILRVSGGKLSVRGVTMSGSENAGLVADTGATLYLDRVTFRDNAKGGLVVLGGSGYDVINSLFVGNGGALTQGAGFVGGSSLGLPVAGLPARFAFNTVVGNKRDGILCESTAQVIEGSLLANNLGGGGTPEYAGCTLVASKVTSDGDPKLTADYRLTSASPCRNFVTDPTVAAAAPDHDIDGVPGPQESRCDCGASEYRP